VASLWDWGHLSAMAAHQAMAYLAMHAYQYAVWCTRKCLKAATQQLPAFQDSPPAAVIALLVTRLQAGSATVDAQYHNLVPSTGMVTACLGGSAVHCQPLQPDGLKSS
jgi:hypothetical protein